MVRKTVQLKSCVHSRFPRVRIIRNEHNLGYPRPATKALEQARGEFIAMLDSDDRAFPTRLEKQVDFLLDAHHDYAEVGAGAT